MRWGRPRQWGRPGKRGRPGPDATATALPTDLGYTTGDVGAMCGHRIVVRRPQRQNLARKRKEHALFWTTVAGARPTGTRGRERCLGADAAGCQAVKCGLCTLHVVVGTCCNKGLQGHFKGGGNAEQPENDACRAWWWGRCAHGETIKRLVRLLGSVGLSLIQPFTVAHPFLSLAPSPGPARTKVLLEGRHRNVAELDPGGDCLERRLEHGRALGGLVADWRALERLALGSGGSGRQWVAACSATTPHRHR